MRKPYSALGGFLFSRRLYEKKDEAYQAALEEFTDMLLNSDNEETLQYMIKKLKI